MAAYSGHNGSVTVDATEIGEVTSFDVNHTVRDQDASVMGDGFTKNTAGQETLEGTVEVYHDHGDSGQGALVVGDTGAFILYPTGNTTAHTTVSATMRIMGRAIRTSHDSNVTVSYTVKSISAVTVSVVPA